YSTHANCPLRQALRRPCGRQTNHLKINAHSADMGLDTVELVMEIEDAFDISTPDDRASEMTTVGDVYEFNATAATAPASDTCVTAAAFYDLCRHLETPGLADSAVRPRTALNRVIPLTTRRARWASLSKQMQLNS